MVKVQKVIFLISFFIFLLFGFQVFAECDFGGWNKDDCAVDIHYTDPSEGSGLDKCEWKAGSTGTMPSNCSDVISWDSACDCKNQTSTTCSVTILIGSGKQCSEEGADACKICTKATDIAGNIGYGESSLDIDLTDPKTTIKCDGTTCSGWYNATTTITLSCKDCDNPGVDCSGCDETYYCIDQADTCSPTNIYYPSLPPPVTVEGTNYVRYYSKDVAGNTESINSTSIKIDKTGPKSEFTDVATPPAGSTVTSDFDVSVNDWDRPTAVDNSGLADCYYSIHDSGATWLEKSGKTRFCNSDLSFTVFVNPSGDSGDCRTVGGTCTVYVYAYDVADNPGDGQFRTFNISEAIPPIVTAFDVSPTLLNIANPDATISWTVTDSGGSHLSHVEVWRTVDLAGAPDGSQWAKIGSDHPAPADSDSWSSSAIDSPLDGIYWYGLHVLDNAGNLGTEPSPIQVTVDKTRPPKPTCDPGTGEYANSVTVTCSCTEAGVTIRYTTDGTSPTPSSPQYTTPLTFTITTTLTVASWDPATNRSATPDNSYTYTIGALPDTIIDSGPSSPTNSTTTTFTFHGTESPTSYQCQLDGGGFSVCSSPKTYPVNQGTHTFEVKAINVFGEDPTPATWTWLVDTTPPIVTSFTSDRTLLNIANPTVTFNWLATDSGGSHLKQAELWKRMVGEGWPASPLDTSPASGDSDSGAFADTPTIDGDYEYGLHILDNAGNWGYEPATIIITVDKTRPPKPTCDPPGGSFANSVTVTCSCTEAGVTIRYTTDGTSPTETSPVYTAPLTFTITTTLTVASWDPATNRSATPDNSYTYTITIDITSPTAEIRIFDSANNDITDIKEWLKADTYTIKLIAKDEKELASGEYYILAFDPDEEIIPLTTAALSGKEDTILLEADAGKLEDKPGTDYWREGVGKYLIWFTAKDEAGNEPSEAATRGLSFDFTPPDIIIE